MAQLLKANICVCVHEKVDCEYGCLLNQNQVKSKKYIHMVLHISFLQLSARLKEYKLNKVKNICPL